MQECQGLDTERAREHRVDRDCKKSVKMIEGALHSLIPFCKRQDIPYKV